MNEHRKIAERTNSLELTAFTAIKLVGFLLVIFPLVAGAVEPVNPLIKDYGLKDYVRTSKDLPHTEEVPWKLVCEMPYNCQFQPAITVEGPAGQMIKFNSSNPLVLYLTKTEFCATLAGEHVYEAQYWVSGEGAVYTIPAGVTVKSVQYRETGFDTEFAGSFECNDSDFTTLWRKAARTAYICMRDHFYDCPDRERVGFWGDGTPEMNQCFYYSCLKTLRSMAGVTGHEADFPVIDAKLAEIKSTFDSKYWKDSFYMSEQVKEPDDRANAMAVHSGLAVRAKWAFLTALKCAGVGVSFQP